MKKNKCKFSNWLSNLFLLLLMALGLALNFNNQLKNFLVKENSETYALNKIDQTDIEKNTEAEASFDFDAVKLISFEVVLEAQLGNKKRPVIGRIAILGVEIKLPIFKGISIEALLYGAGTLSSIQKLGEGDYGSASFKRDYYQNDNI